jgi:hypothetical protein
MRWIAGLWARWRTRRARQRAEYEAMYQASVAALAAAMSTDAEKEIARSRIVDFWRGRHTKPRGPWSVH